MNCVNLKVGEHFEGTYRGSTRRLMMKGARALENIYQIFHLFHNEDGAAAVFGSRVLNKLIENVELGQYIKITRLDNAPFKGQYKQRNFKIEPVNTPPEDVL
jgi:hypothetical protein